ncbi:hypothetical protein NPIL_308311 [Nephila pilipes]|uniref:Uncharacterized protein n=1 Tax=Nephila pilipes TaxID=299642 RepID=A0A8X6TAU5_NEPPI|nr:hypothetical protein NPIL_308311 [Nephila pilipes]
MLYVSPSPAFNAVLCHSRRWLPPLSVASLVTGMTKSFDGICGARPGMWSLESVSITVLKAGVLQLYQDSLRDL